MWTVNCSEGAYVCTGPFWLLRSQSVPPCRCRCSTWRFPFRGSSFFCKVKVCGAGGWYCLKAGSCICVWLWLCALQPLPTAYEDRRHWYGSVVCQQPRKNFRRAYNWTKGFAVLARSALSKRNGDLWLGFRVFGVYFSGKFEGCFSEFFFRVKFRVYQSYFV